VSKYGSPFGTDDGKQKPDAAQKPIAIGMLQSDMFLFSIAHIPLAAV